MCTMVCVRSSTPSFTPRKTSSHRWNVCPLEVLCPATSPTLGLMNLGQVTREPPCQTLHAWGSQNQRPPRRWAQGARPGNQAQDLPQAHSWGSWAWHPPRRWARGPGPGSLCPRGHLSPGAPEPSTHHTVRMKIPAQTAPGSTGTAAPRHHKSGIHCAGGPKCPGQATWAQGSPCR